MFFERSKEDSCWRLQRYSIDQHIMHRLAYYYCSSSHESSKVTHSSPVVLESSSLHSCPRKASRLTRKRILSRFQRMFLAKVQTFLIQGSVCPHMCRCLPTQEVLLQRGWTGTLGLSPCKCPPNMSKSCRWANLLNLTLWVAIWCDWTALGIYVNLVRTTAEMVGIWGCAEDWVEENGAESANVLLQMRRDSCWRDQRGWW